MGMIVPSVIDRLQMKIEAAPNPRSAKTNNSGRNYDYPMPYHGKMIKQALWNLEHDARELREKLEDGDKLPQWVHYKVATAADRVNSVNNYMQYNLSSKHPMAARTNSGAGATSLISSLVSGQQMQEPSIAAGRVKTFVGLSAFALGLYVLRETVK